MLQKIKKHKKLAKLLAASLVLSATGWLSFPYIQTAYKRYQADKLIEATADESSKLENKIKETERLVKNNSFLLLADEKAHTQKELIDSENKLNEIRNELSYNKKMFVSGAYDSVRENLDSKFGLKKGRRTTLIDKTGKEISDLQVVSDFCSKKRNLRDSVYSNELFLKARLKKPYKHEEMLEKTYELSLIPDEFFKLIPKSNYGLEGKLKQFSPDLYNSFGANLAVHQDMLSHIILKAKTESVKNHSKKLYDNALESYSKIRQMNDKLSCWYRANLDGTFAINDFENLLKEQLAITDLIHAGDNSLEDLDDYNKELHTQYFKFVFNHVKRKKYFSHSKLVYDFFSDELKIKYYETEGFQFFYTLKTITPKGESEEEIFVGQKDSDNTLQYKSWDYKPSQQEGWVAEWKQLHNDNTEIKSGQWSEINPIIEYEFDNVPVELDEK